MNIIFVTIFVSLIQVTVSEKDKTKKALQSLEDVLNNESSVDNEKKDKLDNVVNLLQNYLDSQKKEASAKKETKVKADISTNKVDNFVDSSTKELDNLVENFFKEVTEGNTKRDEAGNNDVQSDPSKGTGDYEKDSAEMIQVSLHDSVGISEKREISCTDAKGSKYCYTQAFDGKCSDSQVSKDCQRSCRVCCADDPMFATRYCGLWEKYGKCKGDSTDRMRIFCPKKCRFCKKAPTEPPCVRSTFGCCWDGGFAKGHVGTKEDGCRECKDYMDSSFCTRFKVDCFDDWSKAGEQIRLFCPKTCQRCGPHARCYDDPKLASACPYHKSQGACASNFHSMKLNCPKTCGICKKSTIDCKDTEFGCCADGVAIAQGPNRKGCSECEDKESSKYDCQFLAEHGVCGTHTERMKYLCPATCGSCVGSKDEPSRKDKIEEYH